MFHSIKGEGAFLNDKKINVSEVHNLKNALIGFGFPYDREKVPLITDVIKSVISNAQDLRRTGSAALDLAYVACGRLDGYFELDLELWDYAAGLLILSEAAGKISNWDAVSLEPKGKTNVIASNS